MSDEHMVTFGLSETSWIRLQTCAAWRGVSVDELVRAYVEDWIDIDYPESQGRLTNRGIRRDGPIAFDPGPENARTWPEDVPTPPLKTNWPRKNG